MKIFLNAISVYPSFVIIIIGLTVVASFCNLSFGLLVKYLLDSASGYGDPSEKHVFVFIGFFVAFRFLTPFFHTSKEYVCSALADRVELDLRLKSFKHILSLSSEFQTKKNAGDIQRRVVGGVQAVRTNLRAYFIGVLPVIADISLMLVVILTIFGVAHASASLFVIVVYGIIVVVYTNRRLPIIDKINRKDRALSALTHDYLLNYETIKLFGSGNFATYESMLKEYIASQKEGRQSLLVMSLITGFVSAIGCFGILSVGTLGEVAVDISVGSYLLLSMYLFQIFLPINALGFAFRQIKRANLEYEKLNEIMTIPTDEWPGREVMCLDQNKLIISLDSMTFSYGDNGNIFTDLSLKFSVDPIVFFVGESGSGKSTLIKLMLGLYRPVSGKISINGEPILNFDRESIYQNFSVASQNAIMFNDSIRNNLLIAKPSASDAELRDAVRVSGLSNLIDGMPQGFDTELGETGQRLSGGERQRFAIARAILKESKVIVLDEPTASLDGKSAHDIKSTIERLSRTHFLIIATHDRNLVEGFSDASVYEFSNQSITRRA